MGLLDLYIHGAGSHARKVYYSATLAGFSVIGFIDDDAGVKSPINGVPMFKRSELADKMILSNIFVAIGAAHTRKKIAEQYSAQGWSLPSVIHPSASICVNSFIEEGVYIGANSVLESGVQVGKGAIIDICVAVDHDCQIESYTHLRAGTICQPFTLWKQSKPI
jgi:hypothetical protein